MQQGDLSRIEDVRAAVDTLAARKHGAWRALAVLLGLLAEAHALRGDAVAEALAKAREHQRGRAVRRKPCLRAFSDACAEGADARLSVR